MTLSESPPAGTHPATAPASPWPDSTATPRSAGRRSGLQLAGQLRDAAGDLPRFLIAPFVRSWHLTWGATAAEVDAAMPGDELLPRAHYRSTRAISISSEPHNVWPWLVQVGCGRAGWYADDLLDNFARPSAWQINPEWQDLRIGQWLPMVPRPSERTAFVVDSFQEPGWVLWRTPNRTWSWRLVPVGGGTRLISRMRTVYEWRRPLTLVTVLLMELADYPMMRRMLRGIRARAEAMSDEDAGGVHSIAATGRPAGPRGWLR